MNKFASESEIKKAHSILLAGHPDFDAEKLAIIECNESRDICACPGSGKTTTLLAKLIVLANRMPLNDGRGICVLTHTNVAINEIKAKLGHQSDILFSYPNFFGTIQSFVDKYLAIPFFRFKMGIPVNTIDDTIATLSVRQAFRSTQKSKSCLNGKILERVRKCSHNNQYEYCLKVCQYELIRDSYYDVSKDCFYDSYDTKNVLATNKSALIYPLLDDVRLAPVHSGILFYKDAYSFALSNVMHNPMISDALSHRFKYVFLDEMQDTSLVQNDLLEKIFDPGKIIIQKFGDTSQSIYSNMDVWTPNNPLPINNSLRFGESIARILRTVCCHDNATLLGNPSIQSIKPVIILYSSPIDVLPAFVGLLKTKSIAGNTLAEIAMATMANDPLKRHTIKAVGWVGKEKDGITLCSYFPSYEVYDRYKKRKANKLYSILLGKKYNTAKEVKDAIVNAIIEVLSISGYNREINGKNVKYSISAFDRCLNNLNNQHYEQYRISVAELARLISLEHTDYHNVCGKFIEVLNCLHDIFPVDLSSANIAAFMQLADDEQCVDSSHALNIYTQDELEIEVATIHSVKGETHVATLYLETYYNGYESKKIARQIAGTPIADPAPDLKKRLKMAYVGMSRPRYFLCFAMQKSNFTFDSEELRERWDIIEI